MLNVFFSFYLFNFIIDEILKQFVDWSFVIKYFLYRFFYDIFFKCIKYFIFNIFPTFIQFINIKGIVYIEIILKKILYLFYYIFIKINRRLLRYKKRTKLYYRFGFIKPFRFLFYIYFLILLIYIWQRRTMYTKFYYIYYYFFFYYSTLFCALILYSLCSYYYFSIFFSLSINFFFFFLYLK